MGCLPDKPKKQIKDNYQNASAIQNLPHHSTKKLPGQTNMPISVQKQAQGVQLNNQSQICTQTGPASHNYTYEKQSLNELVKKYKIQVKQSAYKTNSIHAYSYQQILYFNPPADIFFKTEKDILDRSFHPNMNRELAMRSKIRLTNR